MNKSGIKEQLLGHFVLSEISPGFFGVALVCNLTCNLIETNNYVTCVTSWIKYERPFGVVSMKVSSPMCLCGLTGILWIKYERPFRVVSMEVSSPMCLCGLTGIRSTQLQRLHHSYAVPSSSAPGHATTLYPQPRGDSPSHAPFKGPMGALCLTHGYFGPITSHTQVLRQECIHTTLHPSAKLCDANELKVIQTLVTFSTSSSEEASSRY